MEYSLTAVSEQQHRQARPVKRTWKFSTCLLFFPSNQQEFQRSGPSAFMSCMALQDHLIKTIPTSEASYFHMSCSKILQITRKSSRFKVLNQKVFFRILLVLGSALSDRQEGKQQDNSCSTHLREAYNKFYFPIINCHFTESQNILPQKDPQESSTPAPGPAPPPGITPCAQEHCPNTS